MINAIGSDRGADAKYDIDPLVIALDYLHETGTLPGVPPVKCDETASVLSEAPSTILPLGAEQGTAVYESQACDANIRVSLDVLDKLMDLASELVLSRNQLLQAVNNTTQVGLKTTAARLDQVTCELQEAIMQTRMQPLAHLFNRFPRLVRDLSTKLGKQVELVLQGKEVEVDKSIIEAISDPLLHLVRNSLDHGIETPEIRVKCGKRRTGTISLEARHRAGRVNIIVRDDGAGIDTGRLRSKAFTIGLLTAEQAAALSDREAIELIFHPGFSTAEKITDVSGRGVGMDVVKANVARLGGTVEIETVLGRGTVVHIKLPLTVRSPGPSTLSLAAMS
jgi:two-component system chemotaxis sensor kinase CheA